MGQSFIAVSAARTPPGTCTTLRWSPRAQTTRTSRTRHGLPRETVSRMALQSMGPQTTGPRTTCIADDRVSDLGAVDDVGRNPNMAQFPDPSGNGRVGHPAFPTLPKI